MIFVTPLEALFLLTIDHKHLPVSSIPILDMGPPTGPIEYGMMYMTLPLIQPVKRFLTSTSASSNGIQLPRGEHLRVGRLIDAQGFEKPCFGVGTVATWLDVEMKVLDSTRATSFGSVHVNQLKRN